MKTLIFLSYSSLLILLSIQHLFQTGYANCIPSSCGEIRNISSPFRLSNDALHCGDPEHELVCENNVTFAYLNSQKYYVKEINYHLFTIRVVDVSTSNSSICSLPASFPFEYSNVYAFFWDIPTNQPIYFMSCTYQVQNSSLLTETASCDQQARHTYIKVGEMRVRDIENMCTLESIYTTSWNFSALNNISVSEIRQSLLYGYDLTWCKCKSDGSFCIGRPDSVGGCGENHSYFYYKWSKTDLQV